MLTDSHYVLSLDVMMTDIAVISGAASFTDLLNNSPNSVL